MTMTMTRTDLINALAMKQPDLPVKLIEEGVKVIFTHIAFALGQGKRIEIRGFGSFALRHRPSRVARNPKTGEVVMTISKYAPHFKVGKELRERVNAQEKEIEE